jgi:hypothetical protein
VPTQVPTADEAVLGSGCTSPVRAGRYGRVVPSVDLDADADAASGTTPPDRADGDAAAGDAPEPGAARVPVWVVVAIAGSIVVAGVVALLVMLGVFASDGSKANAQDELVAAYQRSRMATYALDGEFSRTLSDGRRLESGALVVQRPPDELRRQLGGTSGRMNGRRVNCSTDLDGTFTCAPGAEVESWDEMVANEVENLRTYFDPAQPVYSASRRSDGCFELRLVAAIPDPPYGVRAVMCFDPASGAMRSIEIEHENGAIDRLEASAIRGVTAQDFALEGNDAFVGQEAPPGTTG